MEFKYCYYNKEINDYETASLKLNIEPGPGIMKSSLDNMIVDMYDDIEGMLDKYINRHTNIIWGSCDSVFPINYMGEITYREKYVINKFPLEYLKKLSKEEFRNIQNYVNGDVLSKSLGILPWDFSKIRFFEDDIDPITVYRISEYKGVSLVDLLNNFPVNPELQRYILLSDIINKRLLQCPEYADLYKIINAKLLQIEKNEKRFKPFLKYGKRFYEFIDSYKILLNVISKCKIIDSKDFKELVIENPLLSTEEFNKGFFTWRNRITLSRYRSLFKKLIIKLDKERKLRIRKSYQRFSSRERSPPRDLSKGRSPRSPPRDLSKGRSPRSPPRRYSSEERSSSEERMKKSHKERKKESSEEEIRRSFSSSTDEEEIRRPHKKKETPKKKIRRTLSSPTDEEEIRRSRRERKKETSEEKIRRPLRSSTDEEEIRRSLRRSGSSDENIIRISSDEEPIRSRRR